MKKHSIDHLHKLAYKNNGVLISKSYLGVDKKHKWKCKNDHVWLATVSAISEGRWCLKCKRNDSQELELKRFQKIAKDRNGSCLSAKYQTSNHKLKFKCSKGHVWEAVPCHVGAGHWCPECAGVKRWTIKKMKDHAKIKNGKCLSSTYKNANTKLIWQCSEGHTWNAVPSSVINGSWCKICELRNRPKKYDLTIAKEIAKTRGGKCISKKMGDVKSRLTWVCKNSHTWDAIFESVMRGTWCNICADVVRADKKRFTIQKVENLLEEMNIKLLSKNYKDSVTLLDVACLKCSHPWRAKWSNLASGFGCPRCAKKVVYWQDIESTVKAKFGRLISKKFISAKSKMQLVCGNNHKFNSSWDQLKRGSWCPHCTTSIGERICRIYFEYMFKAKFPKMRTKWLHTGKNGYLELDGYNEQLGLAFEHHGSQHYKAGTRFAKSKEQFLLIQKRDELKRKLCLQNSVILIEIPEVPSMLSIQELPQYLIEKFSEYGLKPKRVNFFKVSLKKAYVVNA